MGAATVVVIARLVTPKENCGFMAAAAVGPDEKLNDGAAGAAVDVVAGPPPKLNAGGWLIVLDAVVVD